MTADLDATSAAHSRFIVITLDNNKENHSHKLIECKAFMAEYTAKFEFENGQQAIAIERLNYLQGLAYRSFRVRENTTAETCISSPCRYHEYAYLSLLKTFESSLRGSVWRSVKGDETRRVTQLRSTILAHTAELRPTSLDDDIIAAGNLSMSVALEQLMQNFTISLFSSPNLLYVLSSHRACLTNDICPEEA